ncbi:uncharacterized protein LOC110850963 [Folsomia candida]|uniref:Single domain-containing protein n=1 Tax=Folsomia candida TaxID=158441 RepID=A0A226E6L6_FOLCA|nr:uncharacterized protein LOC110850963 [Folsomia candida]OXA53252.1 hypothetical protein Fcan01_12105 [Folsomia candida]
MKAVVCLVAAFVAVTLSQDAKDKESDRPTVFQRLIPADVLRDFPGTCFASTRCATFEPGASWDLKPFCGRSTCVAQQGRLWELVEDCGPLPKPNPKCKLSEKTNKTADFPMCCPVFDCEAGITLEYPDIPRAPEAGPGSSAASAPAGNQAVAAAKP